MTTQTTNAPQVIEAQAGRDVILVVDGIPVVYLQAERVTKRTHTYGAGLRGTHNRYEYCGMGLTLSSNNFYDHLYISGCATTLALEVDDLTVEAVNKAIAKRYGKN